MKTVAIYFNREKTSFQIIKPSAKFNGNWDDLVFGVTHGSYHSFKVFS